MATCDHTPVVRWTPRRINAALRCPKPSGEVARFYQSLSAPSPKSDGRRVLAARLAAFIAQHADFLQVPSDDAFEQRWQLAGKPCGWLLVPATTWLVEALATLDAEHDDLEPDSDAEPDADAEPGVDEEPDIEAEPAVPLVVTDEQRRRYRASDCFSRAQEMRQVWRRLAAR